MRSITPKRKSLLKSTPEAALLALSLVLAACTPDAQSTGGPSVGGQAEMPAPAQSSDDVATLPLAPGTGPDADRRADPALRQEMIPVNDDPTQLLGQSTLQVHSLLGEPRLIRRDGPAEIWQYRASNCILDVFLYDGGAERTVRHVDLGGPGTAMPERRACFARMLTDRRAAAG